MWASPQHNAVATIRTTVITPKYPDFRRAGGGRSISVAILEFAWVQRLVVPGTLTRTTGRHNDVVEEPRRRGIGRPVRGRGWTPILARYRKRLESSSKT